ncbi:MAG: NAD-binding protein [Sulfurimonadaceae bacterium]|nr:NAD-binding protein [Sulfurimonadaceae bacterium]
MIKRDAIIFGYNEYARQIAANIGKQFRTVRLYVQSESEIKAAAERGYDVALFDLGDEWGDIAADFTIDELLVFCALENDAENVFLTISLRAAFSDVTIISLGTNQESANKLKIAGANKVMPILQTTANVITEILEKPIVTELMHNILYEKSKLEIAQIPIETGSPFVGMYLYDVAWHEEYGVIILAVVDTELSTSFIFTSKGHNHKIDPGDLLVVIGYEHDIKNFENIVRGLSE